jgi:DNA-directed RNA polymerase specialized sigma24 family protein
MNDDDLEPRRALASDPATVRWARRYARSRANRPLYRRNLDHLESAALAGLWEAARRWPGDGSFGDFAGKVVRRRVLDAKRELRRLGMGGTSVMVRTSQPVNLVSLDQPSADDTPLGELVESGDLPVGWEVESEDAVRGLARHLLSFERRLLLDFYLVASEDFGSRRKRSGLESKGTFYARLRDARGRLAKRLQSA